MFLLSSISNIEQLFDKIHQLNSIDSFPCEYWRSNFEVAWSCRRVFWSTSYMFYSYKKAYSSFATLSMNSMSKRMNNTAPTTTKLTLATTKNTHTHTHAHTRTQPVQSCLLKEIVQGLTPPWSGGRCWTAFVFMCLIVSEICMFLMDLILWTWSSYSNWPNAPKFIVLNGPFLISIFYLFVVFICLFVLHKLLIGPWSLLSIWLSYSNWPNAPKCDVGKSTFFLVNIFRVEMRTINVFRKIVIFWIKNNVFFNFNLVFMVDNCYWRASQPNICSIGWRFLNDVVLNNMLFLFLFKNYWFILYPSPFWVEPCYFFQNDRGVLLHFFCLLCLKRGCVCVRMET